MGTTQPTSRRVTPAQRGVAGATMIGTTVGWYDCFICANAAAPVLAPLFFSRLEGTVASVVSLATVGISFLFRPSARW